MPEDNKEPENKKTKKHFLKEFWNKYKVIIIIFGAVLVIALILFLLGFRITYAPELVTSWDAVSACAAWAGVIMSIAAVVFAILVPIRIADRQDKIALFEKRYEMYNLLHKWYYLCEQIILYAQKNDDARDFFIVLYDDGCKDNKVPSDSMILLYRQTIDEIKKLEFLFPVKNTSYEKLILLIKEVYEILIGNEFTLHKEKLKSLMESPKIEELFKTMQRELYISK